MKDYKFTDLYPFGVLIEACFDDVHVDTLDILELRQLFEEHQLIVLRDFSTFNDTAHFSEYCEKWGEISMWPFGKVLELKEQQQPEDHIFDNSYMPLHWDGMYRPQIPEIQIFHCVEAPLKNQGGRTTFSNTKLAYQNMSDDIKMMAEKVTGIYHRKMEFYHSKTISPIILPHPLREFNVIRYNEPHHEEKGHLINIPDIEFVATEKINWSFFHSHLQEILYASKHYYAHQWKKNDIILADNFSLLHGREAFLSHSPRHIQRVHVLSSPIYNNPNLEVYENQ